MINSAFRIYENTLSEYTGDSEKVTVPDGIQCIGARAFADKDMIREVVFPDTLNGIGELAFAFCEKLEKAVIPQNIRYLDIASFAFCASLEEINIPRSMQNVGLGAFTACESLERFIIEDNPYYQVIGGCLVDTRTSELIALTASGEIPSDERIKYIPPRTFFFSRIEMIKIPENIKKIRSMAFDKCRWLKYIIITGADTELEKDAVMECYKAFICAPRGSKAETYATENGIPFLEYDPEAVMTPECDDEMFSVIRGELTDYLADKLNVTLPNNIKKIGMAAFMLNYRIRSVTVNNGAERIEDTAFMSCKRLKKVILPQSISYIGDSAFNDCSEELTIYAPEGSYAEKYAKEHNIRFEATA